LVPGTPEPKGKGMKILLSALTAALVVALSPAASAQAQLTKAPADFNQLVKAAKAEGELTVIACPRDWLDYGEIFQKFSAKYGIKINELNPEGSSGEELEAIKANKGSKGRQAPDVLDVALAFGPKAMADKLVAPYKVKEWDQIPDSVKDKDGYWWGGYYGTLAFEVNTDIIKDPPKDWPDLLKPEYKGKFALAGDPRLGGQAYLSVASATLANGGTFKDMTPGLKFFKKLNDAGNFVPIIAVPGTVASGETPITVRWDYLAMSNRDKSNHNPNIGIFVPASGMVAGVYAQAISAYAPHPNAARLYEEYLFSDEGQLIWLKGYGHPIRFADLMKRNVVPKAMLDMLPVAPKGVKTYFPSLAEQEVIAKACAEDWDKIVNVNVTKK
jgi:putative spermidine/putrescine transport system substrate-binding protein